MDNETLFYVCGVVLAVSAVVVTFLGLKSEKFPGRAMSVVVLWFAIFVVGASTFAVRYSNEEQEHRALELEKAGEEIEEAEGAGAATTLRLAADPTALLFDKTELSAKSGKVTIEFDNPSPIPHNVVIEKEGKELAGFDPITEGQESVSAELEAGTYEYICSVPGHEAAGMKGTLTVE